MVGYVPDQLAQHRILPVVTSAGMLWTKTAIICKVRPSGRGSLRRVKEAPAGMPELRIKAMVLVGAPSLLPPPIPRWAREGNQGQAAAARLDGGDLYDEQLKRKTDEQQCLRGYFTGRAGNEGGGLVPVVQWLVDPGNRVRCIYAENNTAAAIKDARVIAFFPSSDTSLEWHSTVRFTGFGSG
jgi:hypothetical protein